jgi:RNA polymerase sigma factor (sigma-70 family)
VKHTHATNESLDLLYTLDPHDDFNTNDEERERMKKYMTGVINEFLTDRQRQIVKMYYGEAMNSNEIAKKLGIGAKSVHKILAVSMKKIQQHKKIFL